MAVMGLQSYQEIGKTIDGSDGITELSKNWKDYRWQ